MHEVNGADDAIRCVIAGQFASPHSLLRTMSILTYLAQSALFSLRRSPHFMKTSLRLFVAVSVLSVVSFVRAGDFVSTVIQANQALPPIMVSGDHFLII